MDYVYKITNKLNGRYYIGKHSTDDIDDGYMGSGVLIRAAIEKYGIDNFKKEVLIQCDSPDEAYKKEAKLIARRLEDPMCYNIAPGGKGGSVRGIHPSRKLIHQFDMDGKIIDVHHSVQDAGRSIGVDCSNIALAAKGRINHAYKYRWSYNATPNPITKTKGVAGVNMLDKNTGLIVRTFDSLSLAAEHFDVDRRAIWNAISGKSKTSCGYKWEYES
jgi:group I intron endonuclease